MKKWLLIGLLIISSKQIHGQNFALDAGQISQKVFFEEIDFEIVHDKIVIPVSISGQSYRFLLDTGAPNIISKRLANKLDTLAKKELNVSDANNLNKKMELIPIPEVFLGSLRFEKGVALIVDLDNHPILQCYKLDGFIGSNFFKNAVLQIDYEAKKIRIANTSKSFALQIKGKPLILIGPQLAPFVALEHENENGSSGSEYALLDTGMDGLYDMSNRIYTAFQKNAVVHTLSVSTGVSDLGLFEKSEPAPQRLIKLHKMQMHNTTFTGVITETTDDTNSRIGLAAFHYGKITIDFNKKKWYYEAPKQKEITSKAPIFSPTIIDQKCVVGILWDESYKDQIQFGNRILRIDQFHLDNRAICDILDLKKYLRSLSSYEMDILNNFGETITLKINKP